MRTKLIFKWGSFKALEHLSFQEPEEALLCLCNKTTREVLQGPKLSAETYDMRLTKLSKASLNSCETIDYILWESKKS